MPLDDADFKRLEEKYLLLKKTWKYHVITGLIALVALFIVGRYWLIPGLVKEELSKSSALQILSELENAKTQANAILSDLKTARAGAVQKDLQGLWYRSFSIEKTLAAGVPIANIAKQEGKDNEYTVEFLGERLGQKEVIAPLDVPTQLFRMGKNGASGKSVSLLGHHVMLFHDGEIWVRKNVRNLFLI